MRGVHGGVKCVRKEHVVMREMTFLTDLIPFSPHL